MNFEFGSNNDYTINTATTIKYINHQLNTSNDNNINIILENMENKF